MKISSSVRNLYDGQIDINSKLSKRVKHLFGDTKEDNWFYTGRVKQLESFALKLETGKFAPNALEDFFACTLVVENRSTIQNAIELVEKYCIIKYRRPERKGKTHKYPDVFSFDDLRLYVHLKPSDTTPPTELDDVIFEVQIKTFLQHAWSIATHDLIYKGNSISWSKARLAYQIKAMLEHAEISIEQVNDIAQSTALDLIDDKTANLKNILQWLQETWSVDLLPKNMVTLSKTIADILSALHLKLEELKDAVGKDTKAGLGAKSINISPYEIIIKAIINHKPTEFIKFLKNTQSRSKTRFLITKEMEVDDFVGAMPKDKLAFTF